MTDINGVGVGLVAVAVGQVIGVLILLINGRNARLAIAAAAKLLDDRTARDRQWALEDRRELAATLAAKVEATAGAMAATVQATAATLAAKVAADHNRLGLQVDRAELTATAAVETLTDLVKENTKISTDAFHEANGAKLLLAEEVQRRNDMQAAAAAAAAYDGHDRRKAADDGPDQ